MKFGTDITDTAGSDANRKGAGGPYKMAGTKITGRRYVYNARRAERPPPTKEASKPRRSPTENLLMRHA